MVEPAALTSATLAALAASKFVEAAAKKVGDVVAPAVLKRAGSQVDAMWAKVKRHFVGDKKAERAIAQIEQGESAALSKLSVYLDDELQEPENAAFARELQQMAQQIVNIGQQEQRQTTINTVVSGEGQANVVGGDVSAQGDIRIGNG